MLINDLFLIWASTAVLAKNPWTYPHSALYTLPNCTAAIKINKDKAIYTSAIDIDDRNREHPWNQEEVDVKDGMRRQSLWIPQGLSDSPKAYYMSAYKESYASGYYDNFEFAFEPRCSKCLTFDNRDNPPDPYKSYIWNQGPCNNDTKPVILPGQCWRQGRG